MRLRAFGLRQICWVALFAFVVAGLGACSTKSLKSLDDVKSLKLGKFGQTVNVDKEDLSSPIKTQWGNLKLSDSDVKKLKKLKKNKTNRLSYKIGDDKVEVVVTYLGSKRYQFGIVKL